jgi:hypothetical protein
MRGSKRKLREGVWELRLTLGKDPVSGRYRRLSKTPFTAVPERRTVLFVI